jgi:hypothetical protein
MGYICLMVIEQTVEIPADHRLTINVPPEVPAGRMILTLSPAPEAFVPLPPEENISLKMITAEQLKTLAENTLKKMPTREYRQPSDLREARMEIAWAAGKSHAGKSFVKYAGCLKDSPVFEGDSVMIQRNMRSEWQ